jgi:predicted transcriptional regulator
VRLLEKKGYLDYKAYGKTYEYFPAITKAEYRKEFFKKMVSGYFDDSVEQPGVIYGKRRAVEQGGYGEDQRHHQQKQIRL